VPILVFPEPETPINNTIMDFEIMSALRILPLLLLPNRKSKP
jgi:hypothetical protein